MSISVPPTRVVNDLFGRIISGAEPEIAARQTVRKWMFTYLGELCLQLGLPAPNTAGGIPLPKTYALTSEFDMMSSMPLPAVLFMSPGTTDPPRATGDGWYEADWALSVGIIATAKDRESTNNLVKMYAAVVRAIIVQKHSLGRLATATRWQGEAYDELDSADERTYAAAEVEFIVTIPEVINRMLGPYLWQDPDEDGGVQPGDEYYTVEEVIIQIDNVEVDEEVNP